MYRGGSTDVTRIEKTGEITMSIYDTTNGTTSAGDIYRVFP
jgi:hypothetical protein